MCSYISNSYYKNQNTIHSLDPCKVLCLYRLIKQNKLLSTHPKETIEELWFKKKMGVTFLPESSFWLAPDPIRLGTNVQFWHVKTQQVQSGQPLLQHRHRRHLGACSLSEASTDPFYFISATPSLILSLPLVTSSNPEYAKRGEQRFKKKKRKWLSLLYRTIYF